MTERRGVVAGQIVFQSRLGAHETGTAAHHSPMYRGLGWTSAKFGTSAHCRINPAESLTIIDFAKAREMNLATVPATMRLYVVSQGYVVEGHEHRVSPFCSRHEACLEVNQ